MCVRDVWIFFFALLLFYRVFFTLNSTVVIFKVCFRYSIEIFWLDPCSFRFFSSTSNSAGSTCYAFSNCDRVFYFWHVSIHIMYVINIMLALPYSFQWFLDCTHTQTHTLFSYIFSRYFDFTWWSVIGYTHCDLTPSKEQSTYLFLLYIHD